MDIKYGMLYGRKTINEVVENRLSLDDVIAYMFISPEEMRRLEMEAVKRDDYEVAARWRDLIAKAPGSRSPPA